MNYLNYNQAAAVLGVSRRTFNRLLLSHGRTIRPLVYNHRLRRVRPSALVRLQIKLRREAEERGQR